MLLLSCLRNVEAGVKELHAAWVSEHSSLSDRRRTQSMS